MGDYDRPSAGTGSGLKGKSAWNYGFLAGVRQLRDEEEKGNMIIGKTKVPGSLNYVAKAWQQFGDQGFGDLGNSGYEDTPAHWSKLPTACRIREGTDGCVNGTNVNWDYEMARGEMTGRMRKMMKIHQVEKGVDGCVGEGLEYDVSLLTGEPVYNGPRQVAAEKLAKALQPRARGRLVREVGKGGEEVARARAEAAGLEPGEVERLAKRGFKSAASSVAERVGSARSKAGSDPRNVGGWSSGSLINRFKAHARSIASRGGAAEE
jgi:hypothetical protein